MPVAVFYTEWFITEPRFGPLLCCLHLAEAVSMPALSLCRQTMASSYAAPKMRMARARQERDHRAARTASSIRGTRSGCRSLATCLAWRSMFRELDQNHRSRLCPNQHRSCCWERAFSARGSERAACKADDGSRGDQKTFERRLLEPGRRRSRCPPISTSTIGSLRNIVEVRIGALRRIGRKSRNT